VLGTVLAPIGCLEVIFLVPTIKYELEAIPDDDSGNTIQQSNRFPEHKPMALAIQMRLPQEDPKVFLNTRGCIRK
jgi:hypothetical protein